MEINEHFFSFETYLLPTNNAENDISILFDICDSVPPITLSKHKNYDVKRHFRESSAEKKA